MIDSLEYNTERTGLIIPEYGRHIQKMVDQAIKLAKAVGYYSAGTVEFVVDKNKTGKTYCTFHKKLWAPQKSENSLDIFFTSFPGAIFKVQMSSPSHIRKTRVKKNELC